MNLIPGLSLRASEEAEILGIDEVEIGEYAVRPLRVPASVKLLSLYTDNGLV